MNYTIGDSVFNDWLITGEIGEGATGKVFEIEKNDSMIQARSALKVIRIPKSASDVREIMSEGMDEMSVTQYFREFVDEILREIKIMVSLKDHPNIVAYEDHSVIAHEDGVGWDILIKMELLTPLSDWLFENPMDEDTVIRLGCEISSALAYAIDSGLVHRDVKPENIFVDHMGRFKLGDFGIARTIEKTTGGLSKKGTENYMAPEVYLGKPYNEQIDIYSLGIVLYRLMNNNRLPFYPPITEKISFSDREAALTKRIQGEPIPAPCNGSREFQAIILKACEYLPENRYESMHELYNALQQLKKTDRVIPQMPDMTRENGTERTNWSVTKSSSVTGSFTGKTGEKSVTGSFGNAASGSKASGDAGANSGTGVENGKGGSGTGKKAAIAAGVILAVGIGGYAVHYQIETCRTYDVVVENGTGAGSYKAGESVTLTAAEPQYGYLFDGWEVTEGDLADVDLGDESISFTMPKTPIELTATYKEKICSLTVTNGNGSGEYAVGDAVSVQADEPEYGYEFVGWSVVDGTLEEVDLTGESLDFAMPDSELALTADYMRSSQELVVNHGSITDGENSGYWNVGDPVSIQADEPEYGYAFSGWEVVAGTLDGVDLTQENLNFEMPDSYVELTANYTQITCSVTVNNGSGAGEYGIGDMVTIQANDPEYGYAFSGWEITSGSLADGDLSASTLTFTMPDSAVELTAQYQEADGEFTWQDENGDTYTGYRQAGKLEGYGTKTDSAGKYTYEGEFVNGKYEGNGKLTYTNGDYYEGTFVNDEFTTGKVKTSFLGDVYEGNWKNGQRSRGTLTYSNGDVYKGTFKEDGTRKKGTLTLSDGSVYEGRFSNDQFNTKKGKYTYFNGDVYEGAFKDGKPAGKGKYTWSDGRVYEGDFVDGNFTGTGKFTWPNGKIYEGDFKDDKRTGKGKFTWANGDVYEGDFVDGERTGTGTYTWADGTVYTGDFVKGKINGTGTKTWTNGDVYVGNFKDDELNGKGTYTWGSGTQWAGDVYEGDWLNGERTGYGKYTYANGSVYEGQWINGILQ